jgi:hypothetical protein
MLRRRRLGMPFRLPPTAASCDVFRIRTAFAVASSALKAYFSAQVHHRLHMHMQAIRMWEGGMRELSLNKRLEHASPESTRRYTRVPSDGCLAIGETATGNCAEATVAVLPPMGLAGGAGQFGCVASSPCSDAQTAI